MIVLKNWPWPLAYKELDKQYPSSKFILTRRKNSEVWYSSLKRHADRCSSSTKFRKLIYEYSDIHQHKEEFIAYYEMHNQNVREYFADRPDNFIELCWEAGDGWPKLCRFLDVDIPHKPFPHLNRSRSTKDKTVDLFKKYYQYLFKRL